MTRDKDFKALVRARMSATGERYTQARAALLAGEMEVVEMVPVTCEVRVVELSAEEREQFRRRMKEARQHRGSEVDADVVANMEPPEKQPMLVLKEVAGARQLTIYCGSVEATAISFAIQGMSPKRPMTHDLLRDVVVALGNAREVRITEVRDSIYLAELLVVDRNAAEHLVPCRPSDGIALAIRADIPIVVAESLFPDTSVVAG